MSKYNQPPKGLFGRYCIIPYGMNKEPFIYRIVNSGVRSNAWIEPPIMHPSVKHPVLHDYMEDVIYVVCDTLINENSKILKVALKDVELIEDREKAHWIWKSYDEETGISNSKWCSHCGSPFAQAVENYCANCGYQMTEGEDV